jgi:glucokinase
VTNLISPDPSTADPDDSGLLAGIDIGGTTTQAVLCDSGLHVLARAEAPTPALVSGHAMAATAVKLVRGLLEGAESCLTGVGIGAAGVIDPVAGRVLVASDSFAGWAGFPVASVISDALDAPAFLDNDVNAFLRGEVNAGSIAGARDALGITLGTGVGGALWIAGGLYDGPHGAAGEIGHVPGFGDAPCTCGGHGHLETLASGRSIAARYLALSGRSSTAREVARYAERGDADALAVFTVAADALAQGILMAVGLLDVRTVVVGGGVSRSWSLLGPLIREALERQPPVSGATVRLEASGLGAIAVPLGAAARARSELTATATGARPRALTEEAMGSL